MFIGILNLTKLKKDKLSQLNIYIGTQWLVTSCDVHNQILKEEYGFTFCKAFYSYEISKMEAIVGFFLFLKVC
jgi:hypothetical protein